MTVVRMGTEKNSWIEPQFNKEWPAVIRLEWETAVVRLDTGLNIALEKVQTSAIDWYNFRCNGLTYGPLTFFDAKMFLQGVKFGAKAHKNENG